MTAFVSGTVSARNKLFYNTFNGVLWSFNEANKDCKGQWNDHKGNHFWQDLCAPTIQSQEEASLAQAWNDSLEGLQQAAKETSFDPLVSSLKIPFNLFKKPWFLSTVARIRDLHNYKKGSNFQPFQIGSQYYLILNEGSIKEFQLFLSAIEKVEEEFKTINKHLGEGTKPEVVQQNTIIRQQFDGFIQALVMYVEGTLPERNRISLESYEKHKKEQEEQEKEKEKQEENTQKEQAKAEGEEKK